MAERLEHDHILARPTGGRRDRQLVGIQRVRSLLGDVAVRVTPECRRLDSPLACYYADDPTGRPRCTLTATIQLGAVTLCASCNAQRSTLGKGQRPVPLPPSPGVDALGWVTTAHHQADAAEATLAAAVTRARQTGASWTVIGAHLGVSRQGAQQRFTPPRTSTPRKDSTTTQTPE